MTPQSKNYELEIGSTAHYQDPIYYKHAYAKRTDDIEYYCTQAEKYGDTILEYGCGSGRILLPLIHKGHIVTGIDYSKPMLDELQVQLSHEDKEIRKRASLHHGDMRKVRLKSKYSLVLATFNTFLHLYTRQDVEQFLARVRAHLKPHGHFIFDVSVPSLRDLTRNASKPFYARPFKHPTLQARCRYSERFDYDPIQQILFVAMEFEPIDRVDSFQPWVTPLTHRQFFPAELEALLYYNGFKIENCEGGFTHEPVDRFSDVLVWTCRLR